MAPGEAGAEVLAAGEQAAAGEAEREVGEQEEGVTAEAEQARRLLA